jgi:hypothetical protein
MMSYKRHIEILKCNFMFFDQAPQNPQVVPKLLKRLQAKGVKGDVMLILMFFMI